MNNRYRWLILSLAILSVLAVGTVWAQSGGGFDAHVNTFDSGGGKAQAGDYVLQSAAGQPVAGGSGGSNYSLNAGIITGSEAAASPPPTVTAVPSPGAFKQYTPQLAKDGVN